VQLAQGIIVAERFRLLRPLGQGGMGAVWLAQHTGLDIPCAVKFIHEEAAQSPEIRARFEREAKAAAQLRSPHVVQILDHGVWQGAPYIAMELLEGEDLGQRLQQRGVLSPRETLAIAMQVGRALAKAHGVGLVHRDLKPANIFLVRDEDREIAKVLDFGVAKVKETVDGSTKTGAVLGTPYYMSPEQARGSKTIDHRSDLWALAVVIYQCITGHLPFMGEALGDLFVKIIVEPLPVPSHFAQVPPGFDGWWTRAAARDPGQRFQTAKEMMDTLALALGVTVAAGIEVGSAMASPAGGHGTMALMTPSQPMAPYQSGQSPPYQSGQSPQYQSGQSPPYQSGQSPQYQSGQSPQYQSGQYPNQPPSGVLGSAPQTGMQQAISVHQVPKSGRGGLMAGVIVVAAVVGSAGVFLALRSGSPAPSPAATTAPAATAAPVVAPTATPAATATPSATPSATAPTVASVAPPASATVAAAPTHVPGHLPPAKPPPPVTPPAGGRSKTDFGF
jgi:serine/threonine-protein kinase